MKSAVRLGCCTLFCALAAFAGYSAAQPPERGKPFLPPNPPSGAPEKTTSSPPSVPALAPPEQPPGAERIPTPAILRSELLKEAPGDDELRKLLKARFNAGVAQLQARRDRYEFGLDTAETLFASAERVVHAGLELAETPERRIELLTQWLELMRHLERRAEMKLEIGARDGTPLDVHQARYLRLDVEIRLLRAKRHYGQEKK